MNKRPKLKVPKTTFDIVIEVLGGVLLLISGVYLILNHEALPETIPIHYNGAGEADGFGDKSQLFVLLFIGVGLYLSLFLLNFFPHLFNYLKEITEKNALREYTASTKLIRTINVVIAGIFSYLSIKSVYNALNNKQDLDGWILPVFLCLLFVPLVFYIAKFAKK